MDPLMARRRHTPDQILSKLRDAEVLLASGKTLEETCKQLEISQPTYHRWRNQYGGMKGPEMKRLKELEKQCAMQKRLIANQAIQIQGLKDIAEGNF